MNVFEHIDKSKEELEKLTTRHLNEIRKCSYIRNTCSCGPGHHCGDDFISEEKREENKKMRAFNKLLKDILSKREPIPSKAEGKALRRAAAMKGK